MDELQQDEALPVEMVPIVALSQHPENYRTHPGDQLEHIAQSLQEHGFYRPIVTARDLTILAGHGVWQAAKRVGIEQVPVHRVDLDYDDPKALKILVADNELGNFAKDDDRSLSDLLKRIRDEDDYGLLGTGYDDAMLANLLMVTRPASEIASEDEAAHWVGMPEFDPEGSMAYAKCIVSFASEEDRIDFFQTIGSPFTSLTKSVWWPLRGKDDVQSVRFEDDDGA